MLDMTDKKSGNQISADAAEAFWLEAKVGSDVLQGNLTQEIGMPLDKLQVALLCRQRGTLVQALFFLFPGLLHDVEAEFPDHVPTYFHEYLHIRPGYPEDFTIGETDQGFGRNGLGHEVLVGSEETGAIIEVMGDGLPFGIDGEISHATRHHKVVILRHRPRGLDHCSSGKRSWLKIDATLLPIFLRHRQKSLDVIKQNLKHAMVGFVVERRLVL